jgi:hypothetical protein
MRRPAAFFKLVLPTAVSSASLFQKRGSERLGSSVAGLENFQGAAPIVLRSGPSLLPGKGFKVSSGNRRRRGQEAGDIWGNADHWRRVHRDRRQSRDPIRGGERGDTRRTDPRRRYLPFFRANVAFEQDSASKRRVTGESLKAGIYPRASTLPRSRESRMCWLPQPMAKRS